MLPVRFESSDPRHHLACDEVLLRQAEAGVRGETLRFYEIAAPVVVLGVGAQWRKAVSAEACRDRGVPILRRFSGGGTVVLGRGCLNYSAVLDTRARPYLRNTRGSYRWILSRLADALSSGSLRVQHAGLSDLICLDRKVGGSAQRRLRRFFLHHGTLLHAFDSGLLDELLSPPESPPDYRAGRTHAEFVANLPLSPVQLIDAVRKAFEVPSDLQPVDLTCELRAGIGALMAEKYGRQEWHLRR